MSAAHPPLGVHLWICPQARHFKGTQTFGRVSRTTISVVRPVGTDRFVCEHLTSSQRKCRLPCFEIPPSLCLPPVECCLGTKPIHAARLRPDENVFQSPTSATNAVATIGPTPGISSSRRLSSLERCQA